MTDLSNHTEFRMLCLGDSYSVGEAIEPNERWPNLLEERITQHTNRNCKLELIAKTGWTTDELLAAIEQTAPEGKFELVTLMIGVNNQYRKGPIPRFVAEFGTLVSKGLAFTGGRSGRLFCLSIPDWGVSPFAKDRDSAAIAKEIDEFNRQASLVARESGATWIDVTEISRQGGKALQRFAQDGLHPSPLMHQLWIEEVWRQIEPRIKD